MVKYAQATVISRDKKMVSHLYGNIPTVVQSSSLTEELGQINYIFSDKTGTLTCNIMVFKKLFSGGESYGEVYDSDCEKERKDISNVGVRDPKLFKALNNINNPDNHHLDTTLLFLSLCHTALLEGDEENFTYCVV